MSSESEPPTEKVLDAISSRAPVLETLSGGPKYNRDIRDSLGVSRSTAYKAVTELAELDIARRGDQGYELTLFGRLLSAEYSRFRTRVENICKARQLLTVLPREIDVPGSFFEGAKTRVSQRHAPNRPVREVERIVAEAAVVKGTGPVVLPQYVEVFSAQVAAGNLSASLILERPAFEHLQSAYASDLAAAAQSQNLTLWVTETELPYGLLVVEEPEALACLVVYDDTGDLQGIISNDSRTACEWGNRTWDRYRRDATRVSPDCIG